MALQIIDIGTTANDGTGDTIRDSFDKVNDNFGEVLQKDFSILTAATTPLAGTEEIAIVQGGDTKRVAVSEFDGIYESLSNKSTSTSLGTSDTLYPTQNAVKTYVDDKVYFNIFWNGQINWQANTNFSIMGNSVPSWFAAFGAVQNGTTKQPNFRSASRRVNYACKVKSFKMRLIHQNNVTQNINFFIQKFSQGSTTSTIANVVDIATVNLTTAILPPTGSNYNIPDSAITLNTSITIGVDECISIVVQNATGSASFVGAYDIMIEFEKV